MIYEKVLEKGQPSIYNLLWLEMANIVEKQRFIADANKVITEETGNGTI